MADANQTTTGRTTFHSASTLVGAMHHRVGQYSGSRSTARCPAVHWTALAACDSNGNQGRYDQSQTRTHGRSFNSLWQFSMAIHYDAFNGDQSESPSGSDSTHFGSMSRMKRRVHLHTVMPQQALVRRALSMRGKMSVQSDSSVGKVCRIQKIATIVTDSHRLLALAWAR